jgi:hypothetical protein
MRQNMGRELDMAGPVVEILRTWGAVLRPYRG